MAISLGVSGEGSMEFAKRSPPKIALIEFCIVLGSELVWSLVRKNGPTVVDAIGIAMITAVLTYALARG